MKRHLKWAALPLILIFTLGASVEPGLKIWQYPNRPVPSDTAFFVLSEGGVTYNVSAFQLRSKMTQGLATVTYVNSVVTAVNTNVLATTNYVVEAVTNRVIILPGGTNVAVVTTYGNGFVTNTIYATNDGSGGGATALATNAISGVKSNDVDVASLATNINFWFKSTSGITFTNRNGLVDGTFDTLSSAIVTQLVTSATQNFTTVVGVRTNQWTTNIDDTPVLGQLWMNGTAGKVTASGARTGLEWNPSNQTLRVGKVTAGQWDGGSNGVLSVAFGSNNWAAAFGSSIGGGDSSHIFPFATNSTIAGGWNNAVSNSGWSYIGGGEGHVIRSNANFSTISGGQGAKIAAGAGYATVGGGAGGNVAALYGTIAGGANNNIAVSGAESAFIGGGEANTARAKRSTIPGGSSHIIYGNGDNGTIGGGAGNRLGTSLDFGSIGSTIGGGVGNIVEGDGTGGNTVGYVTISGGRGNISQAGDGSKGNDHVIAGGRANVVGSTTTGEAQFISGGVSNNVNVTGMAAAIGFFLTNTATKTIDMGIVNANKVTLDTNGWNFRGSTNLVAGTNWVLQNRYVGRFRLASGQQKGFITNALVTAQTIVVATINSEDSAALSVQAIPSAGLLTLKANAAANADCDISFQILTP